MLSNDDTTNIDVIADAGLSTIWAGAYSFTMSRGDEIFILKIHTHQPI
jgi:hypothetical protein